MIKKIVEFLKIATKVAEEGRDKVKDINFKGTEISSVVTETDKAISKLFKEFVEANFSDVDYIIIDEESLAGLTFEEIKKHEYQFVIDPIDGTHPYALGMPFYGISVGILKNCKPFMGGIALPANNEILYSDGETTHTIKNVNMENESDAVLVNKVNDKLAVVFGDTWAVKINDNYNPNDRTILSVYSVVYTVYYMITNSVKGYYFNVYIWDIAGSWNMLQLMGFELYNYHTKEKLEIFDEDNFDGKTFKMKDLHILCREKDFDYLKSIADLR